MYINYGNIDRYNKKQQKERQTANQISVLKGINTIDLIKDYLADSSEGFERILRIYEQLEPNWVETYNIYEKKKPRNIQTFIESDTTIEDIIGEAQGDELMELALTTMVCNRMAHTVSNIIKRKIEEYAIKNNIKLEKNDYSYIGKSMTRYFDSANEQSQILPNIELKLKRYGIDVKEFNKQEMQALVECQNMLFTLKDYSIMKLLNVLKDRDDVNYGKRKDERTGKDTLSVDLPYYGQFAVHLKLPNLAQQLTDDNTPEYFEQDKKIEDEENTDIDYTRRAIAKLLDGKYYEGTLYETENVMLTSQTSKQATEFLKSIRELTEEEQIEKIKAHAGDDARYYNYLMIKSGYDTRGDNNDSQSI